MTASPAVLALDIGGTKMLAALVRKDAVLESITIPTPRGGDPKDWLVSLFSRIEDWKGRYETVGVAVTGIVDDGLWSPLNRRTLDIPDRFPLTETVTALSGVPSIAANDAQAAAWGEYRFGAGHGADIVFLTISTGIGGGIVTGGRLLSGLAGHFGLFNPQDFEGSAGGAGVLEDEVSGNFIAREAAGRLEGATARDVFAAAGEGTGWAEEIIALSAARAAILCRNIKLILDPGLIVIGGGIGLAPGYRARIETHFAGLPQRLAPKLVAAKLGDKAGVVGIADLAGGNTIG